MPHEITVPLQEIKAVLAGARRLGNDLRKKSYWNGVNETGLNATVQTGSPEITIEADVDAYGEPPPDGSFIEITHRFQGGALTWLGVPKAWLAQTNLLATTVEKRTTECLSSIVQQGINVGETLAAIATLQSVTRSVTERSTDLQYCTGRLNRSTRALESRSQQLLASPSAPSAEDITQILHRKGELEDRRAALEGYRKRLELRVEDATHRVQKSGLPEVFEVAAMASGFAQVGKEIEVEAEDATVFDVAILALARRISFR